MSEVQRALHPLEPLLSQDMRIDHCGGDIVVPQQLLNGSYVTAVHQQVRRKTVTECMRRRSLHHPGLLDGVVYGPLHRLLMDVMPSDVA